MKLAPATGAPAFEPTSSLSLSLSSPLLSSRLFSSCSIADDGLKPLLIIIYSLLFYHPFFLFFFFFSALPSKSPSTSLHHRLLVSQVWVRFLRLIYCRIRRRRRRRRRVLLEMAIMAAKIALVVIGLGFTVVFASLVVLPSLDLLRSSQSGLWITVQLIIMAIWKLSDATRHGNRPHNHENPASPPPDAPETWYDVPSSAAAFTTTAPPGLDSSPSPPAEPVIPPEIASEAAASSSGDGDDSMDATWETVAEAAKSNSGDGDDSMDATWRVIMAGGRSHARPVLKKNPTWERVQNLEVLAEKASAGREMRKSKTFKEIKAKAMVEEGWRGRDVLVVSQDELFRRVETFIKKQREHLRLQRQESEQRRSLEKLRRHSY